MLTSVISMLIYLCILALVVYLIIWVVRDVIGIALPYRVIQILWVIVALVAILMIVNALLGGAAGGFRLPALR